jgi:hypothetical protein
MLWWDYKRDINILKEEKCIFSNMKTRERYKAQGAMEYLMSYGWAILVIVAIGATMWYLGLFQTKQGSTITVSGFYKTKPLEQSIFMTPDCNFSGIFVNGAGSTINVTNIEIYHLGDESYCQDKVSGIGTFGPGVDIPVRQNICCFEKHVAGEAYALRIKVYYTETVAGMQIDRIEKGNIYGTYIKQVKLATCAEQGGFCCSPPSNDCQPGTRLAASDCSPCCEGPGSSNCIEATTTTTTTEAATTTTTTTITTTTITTTTTTTTTTTVGISGVEICDNFYYCGNSDGICPTEFCVGCNCDTSDPDC